MSIKLVVLKSGEDVITDVSELYDKSASQDDVFPTAYLFRFPYTVKFQNPSILLNESVEKTPNVKVSYFPWIPFSAEDKMVVSADWVVTVVEPCEQLKKSYEEKLNGNKTSVSEASGMDYLEG